MIGRRAFASKLIKDSNVDVRHKLAKILASAASSPVLSNDNCLSSTDLGTPPPVPHTPPNHQHRQSNSGGGGEDNAYVNNYYCDTPVNDLVDPVDYEDFLVTNSGRITADLQSTVLFPPDDILVHKYEPPLRTLDSASAPEFNNVQTSEDPYIQSIGAYAPRSLVITKKYEKCASVVGHQTDRQALAKELKRQEYEIDHTTEAVDDCLLDSVCDTPVTFCSRRSSVKNTPRPQSLISSSSTVRPPLASDEDDFTDEERDENCRTPQADTGGSVGKGLFACDIPAIDSTKDLDASSLNGDSRASWVYTDTACDLDQFNTFGSKTKSLFSLQNSQSDPHIQGILDRDFYTSFFDNLPVYYSSNGSGPSSAYSAENGTTESVPVFCLHPMQYDDEQIESRPSVPPPSDVPRYRLLVKCLSLKMDLSIEPIFASIAIYDAKEKKKITENFNFDMNPESLKRLLRTHINYQDLSSLCRQAIFSLSQLSPDMYFVIKLEKVLQGDINDVIDAYSKAPEEAKIEKLKVSAAANCERLGRYRMPFAWTAIPLVDVLTSGQFQNVSPEVIAEGHCKENELNVRNNSSSLDSLKRIANECTSNFVRKGSLERHSTMASAISNFSTASALSNTSSSSILDKRFSLNSEELSFAHQNFKPVTITNKIFYRHDSEKFSDDDLYKFLMEMRRPSNPKRLRCLSGTLKLDISSVLDENLVNCRVNPELIRLYPYPDDRVTPIKELLEFRDLLIPHLEHRNLLYVYPKSLNFANRQGSARNISIKMQLLSSEEKFSAMQVIYGKSSCPELLSEAYTAVNYHNRCPNFNEEFKLRLPIKINKQTHLLFTFIHVHTKQKSEAPVEEVVGYTWLPLWREDCLQTGTFALPVLAEAPTPGYSFLTPTNADSITAVKWIDNHKPLFVVQLESHSSIFAQDPFVDRFFRITTSLDSQAHMASYLHTANFFEEFSRAITGLTSANIDSLVKFVHLILNRLILLIVRPPQMFCNQNQNKSSAPNSIRSFQTLIFETVILIVSKINNALYPDCASVRSGILSTFIQFQAVFPQPEVRLTPDGSHRYSGHLSGGVTESHTNSEYVPRTFHEELLQQWLTSSESIREKLFENAFFVFDILYKSLCVHLSLNGGFLLPPRKRVTKPFLLSLEELVRIISEYVYSELKPDKTVTSPSSPTTSFQTHLLHNLNQSFAFFLRDLLSILDRNFVFNHLVKGYVRKLCTSMPTSTSSQSVAFTYTHVSNETATQTNAKVLSDSLFELRVDFLRVFSGHEHFVALNLPFGTPLFAALEQSVSNSHNPQVFTPSSSFAKAMLNSSIFSHSIFDRIRPYAELTDDYRRQHWPLGLIFCTLVDSFTRTKTKLQLRAANLIRSIMTSNDWDQRYKEPTIKSRIACLYFPLIGIMIDVISFLYDPSTNKDSPFYSLEENKKYRQSKELSKSFLNNTDGNNYKLIDNNIGMAIAGSLMTVPSADSSLNSPNQSSGSLPNSPQHNRQHLSYQAINEEATRTLLACFLWVLGNAEPKVLRRFLTEFSNERLLTFLELLRLALRTFEYEGEKSFHKNSRVQFRRQSFQKLEDAIRYGTARRELMRRRDFSQSFGSSDNSDMKLRWRKDSTLPRYNTLPPNTVTKVDLEDEIVLEGNLCTTMNLIVIDSISTLLSIFRERLNRNRMSSLMSASSGCNLKNKYASDEFVVGSVLHVLLQLLSQNQSTFVLETAFHCQRALLCHFPDLLFIEGLPDVEFCSELCYLLLKHCGSRIEVIRSQASASMYLLMRQHFHSASNFSRIKIQITMSLSQLVGTSRSFNELFIRRSLKSILKYAIMDATVKETHFPKQVHELVCNLHMILSDTMQMKEHEQDPEMLLDLMYRVAKGYQNSPELRLTWLQNMAQKHAELSQPLEAAQCFVHAAALVAECLHKISRRTYLPVSCVAFQRVCPNVFEESLSHSNSADITLDKTSIVSGSEADSAALDSNRRDTVQRSAKLFSETGFVSLMEQAANYFNTGGMFEAVNEAYKLLIPIHEAHHRYKELATVHSRLHDVFIRIDQNEGKRVFATYFRVGFYGSLFGDLDREEFIYKERFLTKLPEISHRLESFYGNRFGDENVEVIKDSNPVDLNKLNVNKAYIQITYVEPYWDNWELEAKPTCFDRNYNIKRFIFSTPFTFDGRAHGQLYEQCKRKTILTTTQAFPYVKTRVQVADRQQLVLSPIEVAMEDVQKKTHELSVATHQEPVDAKILQMVLQGCVGTTVNQGPAEIAFVFLGDEPNMPVTCQRPPPAHQHKLRVAFKDFCTKCGEALTKNRLLVNGHDQQVEYHKELERNFYKFTERLAPLMGNTNVKQAQISLRESYFSGFKPVVSHSNLGDAVSTAPNNSNNHSKLVNGSLNNGSSGQFGKYK